MRMRRAALAGLAMLLMGADAPDEAREPYPTLASLPPLSSLGDNGLRVIIAPSRAFYAYAVDFRPPPKNCVTPGSDRPDALLCRNVRVSYHIVLRQGEPKPDRSGRWSFHIPEYEYAPLEAGIDLRLDRWNERKAIADVAGPDAIVLMADGTATGVIRVKDGKVRFMSNNLGDATALGNPAAFARSEVQRLLALHGPSGKVPRRADWTVSGGLVVDPCPRDDFAEPDPDGFEVGEDACTQAPKAKSP